MAVKRQSLSSSWITAASYDEDTQQLTLTMNGGTYDHFDVPPAIYEGLIGAGSPGSYWHRYIKDKY